MKFLADMGVSPKTVAALKQNGFDAVHLADSSTGQNLIRLEDSAILEKALQEGRIVLTVDLDFADLIAVCSAVLPSVVIFRLRNTVPSFVTSRLLSVIADCSQALESGALVTIEDSRYRLRRLPIEPT